MEKYAGNRAKKYKYALALGALFCFILHGCAAAPPEAETLQRLFAALRLEQAEMRAVVWRQTAAGAAADEPEQQLLRAAALLELPQGAYLPEAADLRGGSLRAEKEGTVYTLVVQQTAGESNLLLAAAGSGHREELAPLCRRLYGAAGSGASLNALLIGSSPGKREELLSEQTLRRAFGECGVACRESAAAENFVSLSGWCAELPQSVQSGRKKINVQLAVVYDEQAGRALYYLGYPLIFEDY